MSHIDAGQRLTAYKVMSELIKEQDYNDRHEVHAAMQAFKTRQANVELPDGTEVATIHMTGGKPVARVVDERAYTDWVRRHAPEEIVERVRASYTSGLLNRIEATGEIPDGVEIGTKDSYLTVRPTKDARKQVLDAIRSGAINPLALPAAE